MSALAPRAKYPTVTFPAPGAGVKGIISQPTADLQAKKFGTEILDTWPDGNPIMETRIILRVPDGAEHALYAKGRMAKAITGAIIKAGASDLEIGGELEVTFTHYGDGKNPAMPPKEFEASYAPPQSGAAAADYDDEPPF